MGTAASIVVGEDPFESGSFSREGSVFVFPAVSPSIPEDPAKEPSSPLASSGATPQQPAEGSRPLETRRGAIRLSPLAPVHVLPHEGKEIVGSPTTPTELSPSGRPRSRSPGFKQLTQGLFKSVQASFKKMTPFKRSDSCQSMKEPSDQGCKALITVRQGSSRDLVFKQSTATIPGSAQLVPSEETLKTPRSPHPGRPAVSDPPDSLDHQELSVLLEELENTALLLGYPAEDIALFKRSAILWANDINLTRELTEALSRCAREQEKVQAMQALVASVRLDLAELKLKDKPADEGFIPTPTTSEEEEGLEKEKIPPRERKVKKKTRVIEPEQKLLRKKSFTKVIHHQAFIGATLQENKELEVKTSAKRLKITDEENALKKMKTTGEELEDELEALKAELKVLKEKLEK